jgi:hypothetical protein
MARAGNGGDQLDEQLAAYREVLESELSHAVAFVKVWASNERHPWTSDPRKDAHDGLRAYLAQAKE